MFINRVKVLNRIFKRNLILFSKTVLNSDINCISTQFKREISILSHTTIKLRPGHFRKTSCPKNTSLQKNVLVVDLIF